MTGPRQPRTFSHPIYTKTVTGVLYLQGVCRYDMAGYYINFAHGFSTENIFQIMVNVLGLS